jgi:oligopeptide transport system permease protein
MWSYAFKRTLSAIPTLLAVITVCYLLLHATPGGPFDAEIKVSPVVLANLKAKYHLDEPLWQQYLYYLGNLLRGDLGASFRYEDWTVNELVAKALPVSAAIGVGASIIAVVLGVGMGIVAALKQNSAADYAVMFLGNLGHSFPSFVVGPVLILVFAVWLRWAPAGGWNDFEPRYMVLPMALLVMIEMTSIARVMRGSMIEVMHSNFIRTARAKGLPILPVVSLIGPMVISVITAAVVTESVFSIPGIGKLIINGAANRDYTLVLGLVVLITFIAVSINLIVDLVYALLDPKIRY